MSQSDENDHEDIVPYLDGELSEDEARDIEAKLVLDPKARFEAEAYRQVWDLLDYLPKPEPSPNFTNRTMDKIVYGRQVETATLLRPYARWWVRPATWAAAVLIAVGLGYGASFLIWPSPAENANQPVARQQIDLEKAMAENLPVIENVHLLDHVNDLDFVEKLNNPELFGDKNDL